MTSKALRVAVIGAGPSGFYALKALKKFRPETRVDLFDRLPTPYGLVRGGVAPDHQNIKRVVRAYERMADDENVRFFGNVTLGEDVSVDELLERYDALIYAFGCETGRTLGIDGENLPGVHSASEFVYWYNGHPDYADRPFDLSAVRRVVVVGNGNVSMDVSRILAQDVESLRGTDIADHALAVLEKSAIEEIVILGRRGVAQAAFSPKEIKEVAALPNVELVVDEDEVRTSLGPPSDAWLASDAAPRTAPKNVEFLEGADRQVTGSAPRVVRCRFLASPISIHGDGRMESVVVVRNELYETEDGRIRPRATETTWTEEAQLMLCAIGYRGVKIPGVPYDEWYGTVPNEAGRVTDGGEVVPRQYVVGWAKRGPSGLIGTNAPDARDTVEMLLEDLDGPVAAGDPGDVEGLLEERGVRFVRFEDWKKIDAAELEAGEAAGCVRKKFTRIEDMLAAAGR